VAEQTQRAKAADRARAYRQRRQQAQIAAHEALQAGSAR
jgi:hypothetical protein